MESTRIIPKVGVHKNVPAAEYHAWDALSNSWLQRIARSPAHLRSYLDNPTKPTDAMIFGTAVHSCVLTPDEFERNYVHTPEGDGRKNPVKAAKAALLETHPAEHILTYDNYNKCLAMRETLFANERTAELLDGDGDNEVSVVWDEDGIRCKARLDRISYNTQGHIVVDLKTTTDARRAAFERKVYEMGYYMQGAWYLRACAAHHVDAPLYKLIPVETDHPHGARVYDLEEPAEEAAWSTIEPLLDLYRQCKERDEWPGYAEQTEPIGLSKWNMQQVDRMRGQALSLLRQTAKESVR